MDEKRRQQLGFNEINPWSPKKEIELNFFNACQNNNINVVNKLVEENNNININQAQQNGKTCLFAACELGHLEIVKRLLLVKDIQIPTNKNMRSIQVPNSVRKKHRPYTLSDQTHRLQMVLWGSYVWVIN